MAEAFGIAHDRPFGDGRVPLPSVFVVNSEGRIVWVRVGGGVADRADPDDILAVLSGPRM